LALEVIGIAMLFAIGLAIVNVEAILLSVVTTTTKFDFRFNLRWLLFLIIQSNALPFTSEQSVNLQIIYSSY
jgi:hypothetical protein